MSGPAAESHVIFRCRAGAVAGLASLALLFFFFALANEPSCAQAMTGGYVSFFLESPPAVDELSKSSVRSTELTVAKVRVRSVSLLRGRHPWDLPQPPPKNLYAARIETIDTLVGKAPVGSRLNVRFAAADLESRSKFPRSPEMRAREYFIAFYTNENREHELVGFPISKEEYEAWDREFWNHQRKRERPGAR